MPQTPGTSGMLRNGQKSKKQVHFWQNFHISFSLLRMTKIKKFDFIEIFDV
jgi:hypothetical protein